MDVYTHMQHIYVQTTCKGSLASDEPFQINTYISNIYTHTQNVFLFYTLYN